MSMDDQIDKEEKRTHDERLERASRIRPRAEITQVGRRGFYYQIGNQIRPTFMEWPQSAIADKADQFGRVED